MSFSLNPRENLTQKRTERDSTGTPPRMGEQFMCCWPWKWGWGAAQAKISEILETTVLVACLYMST